MEHPNASARRILVNLVIDGEQGRTRRNAELEADCHNLLDAHVDVGAAAQLGTVDIVSEFRFCPRHASRGANAP